MLVIPKAEIEIPSRRFGAYRLCARVGLGGMAEIYRAEVIREDGHLDTVILKLLRADAGDDARSLFELEADLMHLLSHPNLVRRLEVGEVAGRAFIAMEDVFGGDLRAIMDAQATSGEGVPLAVALHVVIEVLKAVAYFHRACGQSGQPLGLIHGDINPTNVFLSVDGHVKLGDFGVATATGLGSGIDLPPGLAVGKKHYLAPEIITGEGRSQASDLFAVGVMLYELVVGYRPFDGADDDALFRAISEARLEIPAGLAEPPLQRVLERALARTPRARFSSAGAFCGALVAYQLDAGLQVSGSELATYLSSLLEIVV